MAHVATPTGVYYTVFPEADDDRFDPDADWREDLDAESPGDVFLSTDGAAHAVLYGKIPYNKLRSFTLYALGYAAAANAADGDGVWRLYRLNPPTHPQFPFLRVKSVSLRGYGPRTEEGVTPATPPVSPPPTTPWFPYPSGENVPGAQDRTPVPPIAVWGGFEDHPVDTLGAKVFSMRPRQGGEDFGGGSAPADDRAFVPFCNKTSRYEEAKVAVEFHQPNWPVKEDDDPNFNKEDESDRNVFWTTEPVLDVLAIEGGTGNSLFWREGHTVSGGTVPAIATSIPAASASAIAPQSSGFKSPLGFLEPKMMDVANWMNVPTRFIFDDNLIPDKILTVLGKSNVVEWLGYPAGTALLVGVTFQPVAWPIYSTDHYVVNLWNVKYHIKSYDPERRPDSDLTPNPAGAGKRGFKLHKYQDGFSYWATRFSGSDLYQEEVFAKLFEHRQA